MIGGGEGKRVFLFFAFDSPLSRLPALKLQKYNMSKLNTELGLQIYNMSKLNTELGLMLMT